MDNIHIHTIETPEDDDNYNYKNKEHPAAHFNTTDRPITQKYRERVMVHVSEILTVSRECAEKLVLDHPEDEVRICKALQYEAAANGAREWRKSSLTIVPYGAFSWTEGVTGMPQSDGATSRGKVDVTKNTTFAFYGQAGGSEDTSDLPRQVFHRRVVHKALYEKLPADVQNQFGLVVEWQDLAKQQGLAADHPHIQDMRMSRLVYALDQDYGITKSLVEDLVVDKWTGSREQGQELCSEWAIDVVRDARSLASVREGALTRAKSLGLECAVPSVKYGDVGYLILRLLINLGANRHILELERRCELTEPALQIATKLVDVVPNLRVPKEPMFFLSPTEREEYLRAHAHKYGLEPKDAAAVAAQTERLLDRWARHRYDGNVAAVLHDKTVFACLLTSLACMHTREEVKVQADHKSGQKRAIFPGKRDGAPAEWEPTAEARMLMNELVSAFAYALLVDKVDADTMREALALRRSEYAGLQCVIVELFKRASPEHVLWQAYDYDLWLQEELICRNEFVELTGGDERLEHLYARYKSGDPSSIETLLRMFQRGMAGSGGPLGGEPQA